MKADYFECKGESSIHFINLCFKSFFFDINMAFYDSIELNSEIARMEIAVWKNLQDLQVEIAKFKKMETLQNSPLCSF